MKYDTFTIEIIFDNQQSGVTQHTWKQTKMKWSTERKKTNQKLPFKIMKNKNNCYLLTDDMRP